MPALEPWTTIRIPLRSDRTVELLRRADEHMGPALVDAAIEAMLVEATAPGAPTWAELRAAKALERMIIPKSPRWRPSDH